MILLLIGVGLLFLVSSANAGSKGDLVPAKAEDRLKMMEELAGLIAAMALKSPLVTPAHKARAIALCNYFGLHLTAKGLESESGLPTTEAWPGTLSSVAEYMRVYLNKIKSTPGANAVVQKITSLVAFKPTA